MITKLKETIWNWLMPEETETMQTPKNQDMVFLLCLKDLSIGTLSLSDGVWTYQYTDDFKKQSVIQPLVTFPNLDKVYQGEMLWPFFASRIPTINQPNVKEVAKKKHIDLTNTAEMLKEFGQRTITNPFSLQVLAHA